MGRRAKVALSALIILLIGSLFFLVSPLQSSQVEPPVQQILRKEIYKISPILTIRVHDKDGNLKQTFIKEDDLVLNNFLILLEKFFTDNNWSATALTASLNDDGGIARTLNIKGIPSSSTAFTDSTCGTGNMGGLLRVGTGSTAPDRANTNLVTAVEGYVSTSASYANGNITVTGVVTMTAARTITESGLFIAFCRSTGTDRDIFMMFRDTFAGIAIADADTITVTYDINLQTTSFLNTFGTWLRAFFPTVAQGATTTVTLTDAGAGSHTMNVWAPAATPWMFDSDLADAADVIFRYGTGTTAVARTQTGLDTFVETEVAAPTPIRTGGLIEIGQNNGNHVVMTAQRNMAECGVGIQMADSPGSTAASFLMWRSTTTVVTVALGGSFACNFDINA